MYVSLALDDNSDILAGVAVAQPETSSTTPVSDTLNHGEVVRLVAENVDQQLDRLPERPACRDETRPTGDPKLIDWRDITAHGIRY